MGTCTLTGTLKYPDGTLNTTAKVNIRPLSVIQDDTGDIVFAGSRSIPVDQTATFSVDLVAPGPGITPAEGQLAYAVRASDRVAFQPFMLVPAAGDSTVDLTDVSPVVPQPIPTVDAQAWVQQIAQDADAADASAQAAAGSATAAAGSAQAAATSEGNAAASADHAADSATAAATSATAAAGSAQEAVTARDESRDYAEEAGAAGSLGNISGVLDLTSHVRPVTLHATLTGNVTSVSLPTPAGISYTISLLLTQDATGGRTLTVPGVRTAYGVAPVLTTDPGATDLIHLLFDGTAWTALLGAAALAVPTEWGGA